MGKYLRKYDDCKSFVTDYNGSGYTRPWVSLTEKKYVEHPGYQNCKLYLLGLFETTGEYTPAYVWGGLDELGYSVYGASDNEELENQSDINVCAPGDGGTGFEVDSQHILLAQPGYKTEKGLDYSKPVTEITVDLTLGSENVVVNANPLDFKDLQGIVNTYPMLVHMTNLPEGADYTYNGVLAIKECNLVDNIYTWRVFRDGYPEAIEAELNMETREIHFYVSL